MHLAHKKKVIQSNSKHIFYHYCNGQGIKNCNALSRLILMLSVYHENHENYSKISKYVQKYKSHLISDYHHILDKHLNEDKISKIESNNQFKMIYKEMTEINNLSCNIDNCIIYKRNNRERETKNIECKDKELAMFIDTIDTVHCYFLHSVDIGNRIIHPLINEENENENKSDEDNINCCDSEMKQLSHYLSQKRKRLENITDHRRFQNSKFMTHFSS